MVSFINSLALLGLYGSAVHLAVGSPIEGSLVERELVIRDAGVCGNDPATFSPVQSGFTYEWDGPANVVCDVRLIWPDGTPNLKNFGIRDLQDALTNSQCVGQSRYAGHWFAPAGDESKNLRVRMQIQVVTTGNNKKMIWEGAEVLKDLNAATHVNSCGHSGWKGHPDLQIGA